MLTPDSYRGSKIYAVNTKRPLSIADFRLSILDFYTSFISLSKLQIQSVALLHFNFICYSQISWICVFAQVSPSGRFRGAVLYLNSLHISSPMA